MKDSVLICCALHCFVYCGRNCSNGDQVEGGKEALHWFSSLSPNASKLHQVARFTEYFASKCKPYNWSRCAGNELWGEVGKADTGHTSGVDHVGGKRVEKIWKRYERIWNVLDFHIWLLAQGKVLLVREKSGPAAKFGMWKIPTGMVDAGEAWCDIFAAKAVMCCAVGVDHLAIVLVLHLFLPGSSRSRGARSQGGNIQLFSLPTAIEFKLIGQCLMTVYVGQILVGQSLMPALFSKEPFADAALKLCIMDLP